MNEIPAKESERGPLAEFEPSASDTCPVAETATQKPKKEASVNYYAKSENMNKVDAYIEELRKQDDRSCVIMSAARIEFLLDKAIEKRLIDPRKGKNDKNFRLTFTGNISLSYRLGIVQPIHAEALYALLRIRNKAAHFDRTFSLEDHLPKAEEFSRPWIESKAASNFRGFYEGELRKSGGEARALFMVAASTFFVFFKPLATVAPKLDRLSWLDGIDNGVAPESGEGLVK